MKIRVCVGDVDLTVTDVVAYSPDVLEDILARTVEAATKLHVADLMAVDQLVAGTPPDAGSDD